MEENIFELDQPPSFPPLIRNQAVSGAIDPFAKACALATLGCDSGLLVHNLGVRQLRAAIVFAPELALQQALAALPVCGVALQTAFGALAPPEVGMFLTWPGQVLVNGAICGRLRVAAASDDPGTVPDWLVVGFELQLTPVDDSDPGLAPDLTSLVAEGCTEVSPVLLLENWSRHVLVWINTLLDEGPETLHREWRQIVHGIGDTATMDIDGQPVTGAFLGVDEDFGMLLRSADTTHLIALGSLLERG